MKKEAIEYSRLVKMLCTPPPYPLSEGEMIALKKVDTFTVRFGDWDLPCYGVAIGFGKNGDGASMCEASGTMLDFMTL